MNSLWDICIFLGLVPKESPCICLMNCNTGVLDMYQDFSQGMKLEIAAFQNTSVVTNMCKTLVSKLFKIFLLYV
jgi:hypothetical protein